MPIRFLLDENVPAGAVRGLTGRAIDAETVVGAGLAGEPDDVVLEYARTESRVVVTHDDDFVRLAATGHSHSGICYCHAEKYGVGKLLEVLVLVHECLSEDELTGRIEFL